MNGTRLAWHYTVWERAVLILSDGLIRPATAWVPAGELPVVWFSARQHWEPTANKLWKNQDGSLVSLTTAETIERGGGGWRFGFPVDQLLGYRKLKAAINLSAETARGLERVARAAGADPDMWYGVREAIPVADCVIQRLEGDTWIDHNAQRAP